MGITPKCFLFEETSLTLQNLPYKSCKILELGDQLYYPSGTKNIHTFAKGLLVAKNYYLQEKNVVEHTSVDINGRNNSIKLDLDYPLPKEYHSKFNMITNYGTIEHIPNQYQAFKNVHDACELSGIMIHAFPLVGNWAGHCPYYYTEDFVRYLSDKQKYKIVEFCIDNTFSPEKVPAKNMIFVSFVKTELNDFMEESIFKNSGILCVEGGKAGDYSK